MTRYVTSVTSRAARALLAALVANPAGLKASAAAKLCSISRTHTTSMLSVMRRSGLVAYVGGAGHGVWCAEAHVQTALDELRQASRAKRKEAERRYARIRYQRQQAAIAQSDEDEIDRSPIVQLLVSEWTPVSEPPGPRSVWDLERVVRRQQEQT